MFENHVKEVSYAISSVILVIFGDTLTDKFFVPIVTNNIPTPSLQGAIMGTIFFIIWCAIGFSLVLWLLNKLLNKNIIDKDNVNPIAVISFIILVFFLGGKYGWM